MKDPPPPLSPNEHHARHFLDDVCTYLGVASTDANKVHVIRLIEKLGLGSFKPDANWLPHCLSQMLVSLMGQESSSFPPFIINKLQMPMSDDHEIQSSLTNVSDWT
jgi:hypothetical protein